MKTFQLIYYELPTGRSPVKEFIEEQNPRVRDKISAQLELLRRNGPEMRMPLSRALGDGLFELRIQAGNNRLRVLYFFCRGNKIILTNGFVKKTQKTPMSELNLAKKYRNDYERRNVQ